jgi:hypothetical protein
LRAINAVTADSRPASDDYKIEKITELLKLVEKLSQNRLHVIANTNRCGPLDLPSFGAATSITRSSSGYPLRTSSNWL